MRQFENISTWNAVLSQRAALCRGRIKRDGVRSEKLFSEWDQRSVTHGDLGTCAEKCDNNTSNNRVSWVCICPSFICECVMRLNGRAWACARVNNLVLTSSTTRVSIHVDWNRTLLLKIKFSIPWVQSRCLGAGATRQASSTHVRTSS